MATRRYGVNPGFSLENLVETVGAATVTNNIELTVDLASSIVKEGAGTRAITKNEVLLALNLIIQQITRDNWPPA